MCDKAESIHDTDLNDLPDDDYHSLLVAASQPNYRKKASAALGDIPNGSNSCSLSEAARNILNDLQVKADEDQQRTDRLTEVKFAKFMISDFGDLGFANTDYLLQKSKSTDKNLHFSTTKTVMTDKLPLSTENSSSSASSRMTTADQSRAENSVRCVFETGSLFDVSLKNALRLNPDAIQKGLVNCDTLSALSSMAAKINEKKPEPKKSSCNSYFNDDLFFSKINPAWIPQHEKTDANSVARVHHQLLYRRRNKYGKEDFSCVVNHCADSKDTDLLDDLVNVIGEEKATTVQSRRNKHNKKRNEKLIHSDDESAKAGMPKLSTRAKSENSIPETNKKEKKDKKHNNNNNNSNQKVASNTVQEQQQQQQVVKVEEEEEEATATATAAIVNSVPADAVAENKEKSYWSDLMEECADADEEEGAFLPVVNRRFRRGRHTNKAANSEKATRSKTPPMLAPVDRAAEDWNRRRRGSYEHVGRDGELHNNCRTYRVQNRQNTAGTFRGQGRWNGRSRRGGGEHGGGPGGSWTSRAPPAHAVSLQSSRESSPTKNGAATCSSRNQSAASTPALNTALINAGKNNSNSGSNNNNTNNNNGNISGGWKTARPVCESLCLETSNSSRGSTGQVCSYAAITSGRRSTARRTMVVTKDVPETVAESSVACQQQQQQQQQRTIDTGAVCSSSSTGRANSLPASGNKAPLNLAAFPPLGPAVSSGCHVQQQSSHVVASHMPATTLASSSNVVQANLVTAGNRSNNYQRRTLLSSEEQSNNERRRFALVHIRVDPSKLSPTARFAMKMWNMFVDNCDQESMTLKLDKVQSMFEEYMETGQWESALFWCERILHLHPNSALYTFRFVQCMQLAGFHRRAYSYIERKKLFEQHELFLYLAMQCLPGDDYCDELLQLAGNVAANAGVGISGNNINNNNNNNSNNNDDNNNDDNKDGDDLSQAVCTEVVTLDGIEDLDAIAVRWKVKGKILLLKGKALERTGACEQAVAAYVECLKQDIFCAEAAEHLFGKSLISEQQKRTVLEELQSQIGSQGLLPPDLLHYYYFSVSENGYSAELSKRTLSAWPQLENNVEILLPRARRLYTVGLFDEACRLTKLLLDQDRYNSKVLQLHVCVLVELHQANDLFVVAHSLGTDVPSDPVSWYAMACYSHVKGSYDSAKRYFRKATALEPRYGLAWIGHGRSCAADHEHDQAMSCYVRASDCMPGDPLPLLCISSEYSLISNYTLAERYSTQAVALAPDEPDSLHEMGVLMFRMERHDDARHYMTQALRELRARLQELDVDTAVPNNLPVRFEALLNNLGHLYRRVDQPERALKYHQLALSLQPQRADTHASTGMALASLNRPSQAFQFLKQALTLDPCNEPATVLIPEIMAQLCSDIPIRPVTIADDDDDQDDHDHHDHDDLDNDVHMAETSDDELIIQYQQRDSTETETDSAGGTNST
ncbi:Cell division cycle protein 16 -like protein [Trichinella sp. T8]|nr:Cell division cycle protein 16 -like protein [Trichinella sp. T8]